MVLLLKHLFVRLIFLCLNFALSEPILRHASMMSWFPVFVSYQQEKDAFSLAPEGIPRKARMVSA
jgi:hypothetical protein